MCTHACAKAAVHMPATFPVTAHTDYVGNGSIFVAINGTKQDGVLFIPQAIAKGARTIVVHENASIPAPTLSLIEREAVHLVRVADTRKELAVLSAICADNPADKLIIIGVTGTKGKTTTAFVLNHMLQTRGYKTAMLSTVHNEIDGSVLPPSLTTPQPDYIHQFLKVCVSEGVEYVVMEVAAQALSMHRTYRLVFDAAIFTNFSQEHGEFYSTLEDYFDAKCQIVTQLKEGAPLYVNADDAWSAQIVARYGNTHSLVHFGIKAELCDARATQTVESLSRLTASLSWADQTVAVSCPVLLGTYNLYNILAAASCARALGVQEQHIVDALATLPTIPGRLDRYFLPNAATCIIDYAHNPSSYQELLSTLRELTKHLIVVFGCGGERDAARRPVMGSIAARYADEVILTADNPRTEDVTTIITDIVAGISESDMHKVHRVVDRKQAIEYAYARSRQGTIIALLGKGPDEYQIVGTVKSYFSEIEILRDLS